MDDESAQVFHNGWVRLQDSAYHRQNGRPLQLTYTANELASILQHTTHHVACTGAHFCAMDLSASPPQELMSLLDRLQREAMQRLQSLPALRSCSAYPLLEDIWVTSPDGQRAIYVPRDRQRALLLALARRPSFLTPEAFIREYVRTEPLCRPARRLEVMDRCSILPNGFCSYLVILTLWRVRRLSYTMEQCERKLVVCNK